MKFALDAPSDAHQIRAYGEHEVRIGEQVIRRSCIVSRDALVTDWRPASLTDLRVNDLGQIFALEPHIVLLGAGTRGIL